VRKTERQEGSAVNRFLRRFAWLLAAAGLWLLSAGGLEGGLGAWMIDRPQEERMKNVVLASSSAQQPTGSTVTTTLPRLLSAARGEAALSVPPETDAVWETAIEGGVRIRNETQYWVDAADILSGGLALTLPAYEPQILIIHTHGSEAYAQSGADRYSASDDGRTEDTQFNVVRIGDELTEILTEAGLNVIHDRGIYDYPSYTGSYTRAGEAIVQYLESCPGIRVVLDIHRDALGSNGVVYKTMAEEEETTASQVMLLVGTDESGLEHPDWRGNLAFALYLQNAANSAYPTLMRPVALVPQRYNQQLTPGSLIVEVGSSGNTLREALAAIRLFGRAIAPALLDLVGGE
jgi:stage II sporulation protein P